MERLEIRPNQRKSIRFTREQGFKSENPQLTHLLGRWWIHFDTLARTPSEKGDDMSLVKQVVRNVYTNFSSVTVNDYQNGPLEIVIPEYNPEGKEFFPRILVGHLDTVKGTERNPEIVDGVVYSHGPSIDNKGPVAAMLTATEFMLQNDLPHPALRLIFTTDEETDSRQITQVTVGIEERAFIADKSGSIGTIVTGSGGYTGFEGKIEGIASQQFIGFLTQFNHELGSNLLARRRRSSDIAPFSLEGKRIYHRIFDCGAK